MNEWGQQAKGAYDNWSALNADFRFYGAMAIGAIALFVSWWRENHTTIASTRKLPPIGQPHWLLRPFRRFKDRIDIGNVAIDFFEMHVGFLAMSGGFKTTLMAYLVRQRLKRKRNVVVITGGDSDQLETEIRAAGGWIIRPHQSPLTFNAFEGTPSFMAQGWASLFPTNSEAKVYHSAFEIACIRYFESTRSYSLAGLKNFVLNYTPPDDTGAKLWKGMKEGYVGIRLELMEMAFGDWIGNDLSINEAMQQNVPLMFVLDSANDPDLNRFAAALVWQAVNFAARETGHFDVFVDELGRLPKELIGDQVRTWRRNDCHLLAGTHASADFTEIMGDLIHVWCLGRMTASALRTRTWAQQVTWGQVPRENFGAHALPRGGFYVVDLQRVQMAVLPTYHAPRRVLPRRSMRHLTTRGTQASGQNHGSGTGHAATDKAGPSGAVPRAVPPIMERGTASEPQCFYGPIELPRWVGGPNAERKMEIFGKFDRFTGLIHDPCVETNYALKGNGKRPGCEYDGRNWMVYDLVVALDDCRVMGLDSIEDERAYLALVKMKLGSGDLSVDHKCENRRCVRREHHEWETKSANIDLFWERWREKRAAGAFVA